MADPRDRSAATSNTESSKSKGDDDDDEITLLFEPAEMDFDAEDDGELVAAAAAADCVSVVRSCAKLSASRACRSALRRKFASKHS